LKLHSSIELLDQAAAAGGIEPEYWDIWGRHHITPPGTKQAILNALGIDASSAESLQQALAARAERERRRTLAPCLVIGREQRPWTLAVNAPDGEPLEIRREDGSSDRLSVRDGQVDLPDGLELGYHEAICRGETMRLIVAPERAYLPGDLRSGGVAVSLYGLRSSRNWGAGDLTDLAALIDWAADELRAGFISLNPLHSIPNRRPYNTSPYLPTSVFYQNLLYLDVEAISDFRHSRRARDLRAAPEVCAEIEALRASEFVEYERVHALKLRFLKLCFIGFLRGGGSEAFERYREREGELLERFALYCALDEWLHARNPDLWIWPEWPEPFRDPDSVETRAFAAKHKIRVLFYQYVQWRLSEQLAAAQAYAKSKGLPIGLYHDLALATDRCGADLWAHRSFYVAGCRVGSPPDDFAPLGQDWAFPPPNGDRHRETGYRLFTESIRKNCRAGGALRIDHVMRFFRLYWIPDSLDAASGAYVRDHAEDLIRIVALESVRNRVIVVGEDLGTVEPRVRETLSRFGILSYRLLFFEKKEGGEFRAPAEYPAQALAASTTHDLPTIAGFWTGADIEVRRAAGMILDDAAWRAQVESRAWEKQKMLDALHRARLLPEGYPANAARIPELTGELHNAIVAFLALTPSQLLVVNQEDLTKEVAQQNLPSTTWQYPNWGRKMKFTVEELRSSRTALDFTAMFRHWLITSGRALPHPPAASPGGSP
jgi:4-alpha-glucanotransferase